MSHWTRLISLLKQRKGVVILDNKTKNNQLRDVALYKLMVNVRFLIIVNLLFLISIALPMLWLMLFGRSVVDIVVVGLLLPGLAALVSCILKYRESKRSMEFKILYHFLTGFRDNLKDTLKYCFAIGVVTFAVWFNLAVHGEDLSFWLGGSLVVLSALTALVVTYMLVVAAKFQFRTRDLLRVAGYCLLMNVGKSLKLLVLYVVVFFAWPWVGMFTMLMLASTIAYFVVQIVEPVLPDVHAVFVVGNVEMEDEKNE